MHTPKCDTLDPYLVLFYNIVYRGLILEFKQNSKYHQFAQKQINGTGEEKTSFLTSIPRSWGEFRRLHL